MTVLFQKAKCKTQERLRTRAWDGGYGLTSGQNVYLLSTAACKHELSDI